MESSEEAFEKASRGEVTILEEILATTATVGADEASEEGLPIASHLYEGFLDLGPSASFLDQGSQAGQYGTSSTRQNYLSCQQLWLDIFMHQAKEGLPVPCTHLA